MRSIYLKEIQSFLYSLTGYLVLAVFLVSTGLIVWIFPASNALDTGYADLHSFFSLTPYVFLFLIPAITMRSFAEEQKSGTLELLLTRPLSDWKLVFGKFLACWTLVALSLVPTLLYYWTIWELSLPTGNVDSAAIMGSYIGLFFLGGVFAALGIFASSLTQNQIIAFLLAVFLSFMLYEGISALASINLWSAYALPLSFLGLDEHYRALSRGLLDARNVLYFSSVVLFLLWLTKLRLASRLW